jgi:hypothetical protein
MPLSEEEQRILREMEAHLYAQDKGFVDRVASETIYRHAGKKALLGLLVALGGLVVLIYFLSTSIALSFAGFLIMLFGAMMFGKNISKLSKAGWQDVASSFKENGLAEAWHEAVEKLRSRLKKDKP